MDTQKSAGVELSTGDFRVLANQNVLRRENDMEVTPQSENMGENRSVEEENNEEYSREDSEDTRRSNTDVDSRMSDDADNSPRDANIESDRRDMNDSLHKRPNSRRHFMTQDNMPRRERHDSASPVYRSKTQHHNRLDEGHLFDEKKELLEKFERLKPQLKKSGITLYHDYNIDTINDISLENMKYDYDRVMRLGARQRTIQWYKGALTTLVGGLEMANKTFNPYEIPILDGWSDSVRGNIDSYEDIFAELFEKYHSGGSSWPPELRLAMMLGQSAIMCHMSHTLMRSNPLGLGSLFQKFKSKTSPQPRPSSAESRNVSMNASDYAQKSKSTSQRKPSSAEERFPPPSTMGVKDILRTVGARHESNMQHSLDNDAEDIDPVLEKLFEEEGFSAKENTTHHYEFSAE